MALNTFGAMGLLSRSYGGYDTLYAFDERGDVAQRLDQSGNVPSADVYDGYGRGRSRGRTASPSPRTC